MVKGVAEVNVEETSTTQKAVTVNLTDTLRSIHYQLENGCCSTRLPDKEWLWADAICINQDDDTEKNCQIRPMAKVYLSAHRVFSWLRGKEEDLYGSFCVPPVPLA
jgi:hypothetical protein